MPDPIITALRERAERAEAEVERLKAGGCARDQTTTQYCAEAVEAIARAKRAERELASIHAEAASALGWALNMAAARVADGCALRAVQHALGEWQGEKGRCRSERERAGRAERELAEAGLRGSPPPGRSMVDRMQQAEAAIEACAPHLKDGETPADCIARNRADVDAALALLAKRAEERDEARRNFDREHEASWRNIQRATEQIDALRTERDRLREDFVAALTMLRRLRLSWSPFARIVRETSGRIPTERLALADWHRAAVMDSEVQEWLKERAALREKEGG